MYKVPAEISRFCARAERERSYRLHQNKMKHTKAIIDTSNPSIPRFNRVNPKKLEIERQQKLAIEKYNKQFYRNMDLAVKNEKLFDEPQKRLYVPQNIKKQEAMERIEMDNKLLSKNVQKSKAILNREEWYKHKIEHEYRHRIRSEYMSALPLKDIKIKDKEAITARRTKKTDEEEEAVHSPTLPTGEKSSAPRRPIKETNPTNHENQQQEVASQEKSDVYVTSNENTPNTPNEEIPDSQNEECVNQPNEGIPDAQNEEYANQQNNEFTEEQNTSIAQPFKEAMLNNDAGEEQYTNDQNENDFSIDQSFNQAFESKDVEEPQQYDQNLSIGQAISGTLDNAY